MWRQNAFPGNSDTDQSISDEEDLNREENCFSLNMSKEKEQLPLQLRLELLTDKDDNQSNLFVEDEVEMPDFPNEGGLMFSRVKESRHLPDEEIISDSEDDYVFSNYSITSSATKLQKDKIFNSFRSEKQDGACSWSMISKEAEALIHLNDNAFSSGSNFSKANKSCKGVGGKVKSKFSLNFKLHKDVLPQCIGSKDEKLLSSSVQNVPEQLEPAEDATVDKSNREFLEDFHGEINEQLKILPTEEEAVGNGLIKRSMAELLDGLQDRNVMLGGTSKMSGRTRGKKRAQLIVKKHLSPPEERISDIEDQPELVVSETSDDDEADYQDLNVANPVMKKQTMTDQFQEALAATSVSNEGCYIAASDFSSTGLFGKLQQVMQSEKERDADFLKRMHMGPGPNDESNCIFVKILSRYLDAKLIVCRCSFGKNREEFQLPDSSQTLFGGGREGTVIFSPRVCSNVDLDVGNFICICPPWKEVQVIGNTESIVLSAYFFHI